MSRWFGVLIVSSGILGYLFLGVATQNPEWYPLGLVITYLAGITAGLAIWQLWVEFKRQPH